MLLLVGFNENNFMEKGCIIICVWFNISVCDTQNNVIHLSKQKDLTTYWVCNCNNLLLIVNLVFWVFLKTVTGNPYYNNIQKSIKLKWLALKHTKKIYWIENERKK